MADLKFKYGTSNINGAGNDPGTIYVQRTGNGKAKMYIDNPTVTGADRLQIGGDIFVGDPDAEGSGAGDYDVIINPDGEVIENWVTTEIGGGFVIRIESSVNSEDIDNWTPTDTPSKNTIIFVVES